MEGGGEEGGMKRGREGGERSSQLPDFDVIRQQPAIDGLRGMCHEHSTLEGGLGIQHITILVLWPHYKYQHISIYMHHVHMDVQSARHTFSRNHGNAPQWSK